ncbi:dolichyl-phosphate-mannose--protein mannosyltransferase [Kineococcus gynurae]|uniref:Polyprenol-phosphate-mannose--protein mannosyltransferase n=1 Tax=Kineococcus gynurae TaxID=452979 RepID=A0ABV5LWP1_9ACTN
MSAALAPASRGADPWRVRLLGPRSEIDVEGRLRGWVPLLVVTAVAGVLRFWHLGRPHQLVFDETYYVKQAYSLLLHGVERRNDGALSSPDALFTAGTPDVFGTTGDFVVHPSVGKWMIAVGEWLFGIDSSFGWRFSAALVGTLSVLLLGRVARRLFRSTLLGVTAAVLLTFEGQHLVESRTSLLDIFLMWWVLVAFACLLIDRDQARDRLARRLAAAGPRGTGGFGPRLGMRWWRLAAGVSLGLACGVKWSGVYVLAVFGIMTVLWDASARRAVGIRAWPGATVERDGIGAFLVMVPVAVAVYVSTWAGWFASREGYLRQWGAEHPASGVAGLVPDALRSLWHYHAEAYAFHVGLSSPHPYSANPWTWLVQGRPTSFFYEKKVEGQDGCLVQECSKAITSLGTPLLWWAAVLALVLVVFCWAFRRDWRAGAILAGLGACYLPWFQYQHRTIFTFYAVVFVPFVVLALTYAIGVLLGPDPRTALGGPATTDGGIPVAGLRGAAYRAAVRRRRWGAAGAGLLLVAIVACFWFFWPIWTAQVIPHADWSRRMWLPSWV